MPMLESQIRQMSQLVTLNLRGTRPMCLAAGKFQEDTLGGGDIGVDTSVSNTLQLLQYPSISIVVNIGTDSAPVEVRLP